MACGQQKVRQFCPWLTSTPVTREVCLLVPFRLGAWAMVEDILDEAKSLFCPIVAVRFLHHSERVTLDGETEYQFRIAYQHPDKQLTKTEVAKAHEYLLGRLAWATEAFNAMGERWREYRGSLEATDS